MTAISRPEQAQPGPALKVPGGPRGYPLVGCLPDIQRDRLAFVASVARDYPEVARYRVANVTLYQVNQPAGIEHVLQDNHRNYAKGRMFEDLRRTLGNGLLLSEGSFWLRQRRLMQPAFHRRRIAGFVDLAGEEAEALAAGWQRIGDGKVVDVLAEVTRLTMNVVSRALFGIQMPDDIGSVSQAITTMLADVTFRFERPWYPKIAVPTPYNRRLKAAVQTLDDTVQAIIDRRRKLGAAAPHDDFLAMLMEARDEETGEAMTDKQLRDEVLTFFAAGHETTATALAWTFYLLSGHPEVAASLQAELAQTLGGRIPSADDLPSLRYTGMVLQEAMRLYPPAWLTNRTALSDDEIAGYHIPAGAVLTISPYAVHHSPIYWEDPERFDPERFAPERSAGRPHYAYFPFGGGPRICIGQGFAMAEAQVVLATLLQRFRLELVPGHAVEILPQVTLRPRGGLPMTLHRVRMPGAGAL